MSSLSLFFLVFTLSHTLKDRPTQQTNKQRQTRTNTHTFRDKQAGTTERLFREGSYSEHTCTSKAQSIMPIIRFA